MVLYLHESAVSSQKLSVNFKVFVWKLELALREAPQSPGPDHSLITN